MQNMTPKFPTEWQAFISGGEQKIPELVGQGNFYALSYTLYLKAETLATASAESKKKTKKEMVAGLYKICGDNSAQKAPWVRAIMFYYGLKVPVYKGVAIEIYETLAKEGDPWAGFMFTQCQGWQKQSVSEWYKQQRAQNTVSVSSSSSSTSESLPATSSPIPTSTQSSPTTIFAQSSSSSLVITDSTQTMHNTTGGYLEQMWYDLKDQVNQGIFLAEAGCHSEARDILLPFSSGPAFIETLAPEARKRMNEILSLNASAREESDVLPTLADLEAVILDFDETIAVASAEEFTPEASVASDYTQNSDNKTWGLPLPIGSSEDWRNLFNNLVLNNKKVAIASFCPYEERVRNFLTYVLQLSEDVVKNIQLAVWYPEDANNGKRAHISRAMALCRLDSSNSKTRKNVVFVDDNPTNIYLARQDGYTSIRAYNTRRHLDCLLSLFPPSVSKATKSTGDARGAVIANSTPTVPQTTLSCSSSTITTNASANSLADKISFHRKLLWEKRESIIGFIQTAIEKSLELPGESQPKNQGANSASQNVEQLMFINILSNHISSSELQGDFYEHLDAIAKITADQSKTESQKADQFCKVLKRMGNIPGLSVFIESLLPSATNVNSTFANNPSPMFQQPKASCPAPGPAEQFKFQ
jgi:hypothetical protein